MSRLDGLRWLVRLMAERCGESEGDIEKAFLVLVERGHVRVLPGEGPDGTDVLELTVEAGGPFKRYWLQ